MSSYGSTDRRIPVATPEIFVADELKRRAYGCYHPEDAEKDKLEYEAVKAAYDKLDGVDRYHIESILKQFTGDVKKKHGSIRIKNIGQIGMLELLAKLGIWLDAVERERP